MAIVADSGTSRSNNPRVRVFTRDEILTATYSNGLPANHKLVIGVLMWWADPATGAIPPDQRKSIAEIAKATSLSHATVCRVLGELDDQGWVLRRQPPPAEQRAGGKTGYRLIVPASHQVSLVSHRDRGSLTQRQARPAETQSPRSALSHSETEVLSTSSRTVKPKASRPRRKLYCPEFAAWYEIYPRHEGKAEAAKAFQRTVFDPSPRFDSTDLTTLMDATLRFAEYVVLKRLERQFIKLPATWLNKACWNDELDMSPAEPEDDGTGVVNPFAQYLPKP